MNIKILRAHLEGPQRLSALHSKVSWPPQTTLRAGVGKLREVGVLERTTAAGSRFSATTVLTPAGREMIFVADVVERWLALSPTGPISADSDAAKGAVKALAGGWSSTLMRALANRPFTLTELDGMIPDVSYASLERRLVSMRFAGQIKPLKAEGRGTPYVVTEWLRRSIAPLAAAGRWERRHLGADSAPITDVEVEAAFMLALPLASMPPNASGTCMLAVQTESRECNSHGHDLSGVTVELEHGEVASCSAGVDQSPPTWALGTAEGWLNLVIDGDLETLRLGGGRPQLALSLINGLHIALFGA
jgi:DNA-binding HxlR family transcriptional regulator